MTDPTPHTFTLACPIRDGETFYELRLEATCQTTYIDSVTLSPRSEPLVVTVPEPVHGLLIGALLLAGLLSRPRRNQPRSPRSRSRCSVAVPRSSA